MTKMQMQKQKNCLGQIEKEEAVEAKAKQWTVTVLKSELEAASKEKTAAVLQELSELNCKKDSTIGVSFDTTSHL